jgi:hypothetical protein
MRDSGPIRKGSDGDAEAAAPYVGTARTLLGVVKNQMRLGGLSQLSRTFQLADGTTISVSSRFGQDAVRIAAATPAVPSGLHVLGQRGENPEQVDLPVNPYEEPPPLPQRLIGALCSSGQGVGVMVYSTLNGVTAQGLDSAGDIPRLVPCMAAVNYTVGIDPNVGLPGGGFPLPSLQIYDVMTTPAGPHGDISAALQDENCPLAGGITAPNGNNFAQVPSLFSSARGIYLPRLQILKWKQTGGAMQMFVFTEPGSVKGVGLVCGTPVRELFGAPYWTPFYQEYPDFGLIDYVWQVTDDIDPASGFPIQILMVSYILVAPALNNSYTATGELVVMDSQGNVSVLLVNITLQYRRSGNLILQSGGTETKQESGGTRVGFPGLPGPITRG